MSLKLLCILVISTWTSIVSAGHSIIGLAVDYLEELIFYCDVQAGVTTSLSYSGSTETLILPENDTVAIVPDMHSK